MNTIRFQLTVRFAGALLITMFAFALAVWEARRSGAAEEVRRTARAEAEIVLAVLRQTEESGQPVTVVRDPAVGPVLTSDLRSLVEGMPDYVAVLAQDGRLLALSASAVSHLSADDSRLLDSTALAAPAGGSARLITLGAQPMLLVIRQPLRDLAHRRRHSDRAGGTGGGARTHRHAGGDRAAPAARLARARLRDRGARDPAGGQDHQ
jgi:hypothetical protein